MYALYYSLPGAQGYILIGTGNTRSWFCSCREGGVGNGVEREWLLLPSWLYFFFFPYYNSIAHKYILSFMKLNFALIWLATEFRGLLPKFPNIF